MSASVSILSDMLQLYKCLFLEVIIQSKDSLSISLKLSNSHQNNPDGLIALQVRGKICIFNFSVNCPFNLLCFHCVMGVSEHEGVFPLCTYPSSVGSPPSSRWPVCRAACPVIHSVVPRLPRETRDLNPAPERLMQFMASLLCLARSFKQ